MLDSGAMVSCISKTMVKRMLLENKQDVRLRGTALTLHHAGNNPLKVLGEAVLKFKLSGKPFTWTFLVVAGLSHEIILGEDFQEKLIRSRHVYNHTLEFADGSVIPYFKRDMDVRTSYVHVMGTHTIAPYTSKFIPIISRKHIPNGNISAIFIPKQSNARTRMLNYEMVDINKSHMCYSITLRKRN